MHFYNFKPMFKAKLPLANKCLSNFLRMHPWLPELAGIFPCNIKNWGYLIMMTYPVYCSTSPQGQHCMFQFLCEKGVKYSILKVTIA